MSENNRPTRRGSRRQFLRRVTGTLATTGLLGVAGCVGNRTESGDDGQPDAELVTRTVEENVTGPGDGGDLVGASLPEGPPEWVDTAVLNH
jgi:hypothetical protein